MGLIAGAMGFITRMMWTRTPVTRGANVEEDDEMTKTKASFHFKAK